MAKKYTVKYDTPYAKKGTILFGFDEYDYGLSYDDTRITGKDHISVTLVENGHNIKQGGSGFYSVPLEDLEEFSGKIEKEDIVITDQMVKNAADAVRTVFEHYVKMYGLRGASVIVPSNHNYIRAALESVFKKD